MSPQLHKLCWLACMVTLCTTAFLFAGSTPQQGVAQSSSTTKAVVYFPPDAIDGFASGFFSSNLSFIGEPSLLAAAQDPSALSYRVDWLAAQTGYVVVVRLSLNADGSATTISTVQPGVPGVRHKTQNSVCDADVKKFVQMVENANFWSMPTIEQENPKAGRRAYKMDASTWVFEGVRNGSYHVVSRRGPEQSPFTEMVRFLAKDLAKLDEPSVPRAYPIPSR